MLNVDFVKQEMKRTEVFELFTKFKRILSFAENAEGSEPSKQGNVDLRKQRSHSPSSCWHIANLVPVVSKHLARKSECVSHYRQIRALRGHHYLTLNTILAKKSTVVCHPPYPHDLETCDFHLLKKTHNTVKYEGIYYQHDPHKVTRSTWGVSKDVLYKVLPTVA